MTTTTDKFPIVYERDFTRLISFRHPEWESYRETIYLTKIFKEDADAYEVFKDRERGVHQRLDTVLMKRNHKC